MSNSNDDTTALTRLLVKAGRRTEPPGETREAVYVSALVAWQQAVWQRRRQRQLYLAVAASIVAAVALLWYAVGTRPPDLIAATHTSGQAVRVGEILRVNNQAGMVLNTSAGEQLRIASGSVTQFVASERIKLLSGRIYVQSTASAAGAARLVVDTDFGSVTHVGTRYMVDLTGEQLAVSVRNGVVAINAHNAHTQVSGGMQVVVDRAGRQSDRRVASNGDLWAWSDKLAPALQIDGRRLSDVLQEIAFETGRRLEFADDGVRRVCGEIELKGPFLDMAAPDRLFAVLITTGLEAVENGDRILIQRQLEDTVHSRGTD
jgi:ferric-dicitrate binding protein FerR (iron transport regulator)